MKENKFGMNIPGPEIRAPWAMKVTVIPDGIKWESDTMAGEILYITPRQDLSGAIVSKGTVLGTTAGQTARFQISGIDPRLIFKLIDMAGRL